MSIISDIKKTTSSWLSVREIRKDTSEQQQLSNFAAAVGAMDKAEWQEMYLQHARGDRNDIIPFPTEDIQTITNNQKGETTARAAISTLDAVLACVTDITPIERSMRVLDYGCGWGRMTRLLPIYVEAERIAGADVDKSLVNSANELLPNIKHVHIESMKPLPFADGSFDIIFANSVFSHLSEKSCLFTLGELSRILDKGGIVITSVLLEEEMNNFYSSPKQKDWIRKILGDFDAASAELANTGFVWGDTGRWHEYGIAVMSEPWIEKKLLSVGVEYRGTRRAADGAKQNYSYGIKQ